MTDTHLRVSNIGDISEAHYTLAAMTRVTWPITVGAVLYFLYAAAFLTYSLAAYFVGDAKLSAARALLGAFVAFVCGVLGTALLRAKDGNTGWLLWTGGAAGALAGMSAVRATDPSSFSNARTGKLLSG